MLDFISNRYPFFFIIFHVIIGGLSILSPWVLILWFYFIILLSSVSIIFFKREKFFIRFVYLISYTVSFELLGRMSGTSPYIPYEVGKYLLFCFLVAGIFAGYRKGSTGWIMLILLLPALFIDESGQVWFKNIVFNILGPVNVALAVIFFRYQQVTGEEFKSVLKLLSLPLVSALAFVMIKAPDFSEFEFSLGSNFAASGGWGPNQVSTALGTGAFITFIFWLKNWKLSGSRWLDFILFLLFSLRGLLTFSRGGMIVALAGIIAFIYFEIRIKYYYLTFSEKFVKEIAFFLPAVFIVAVLFSFANRITEGNLALRYMGETPGTLAGYKEKTLNVLTANRLQVFIDDLKLLSEYPFTGTGAGASYYLRESTRNVAPHVELSRLISEHGIPGLIYFIIWVSILWKIIKKMRMNNYGTILAGLIIIAFLTTFHSAMRTFITPLLTGLSMLEVSDEYYTEYPE